MKALTVMALLLLLITACAADDDDDDVSDDDASDDDLDDDDADDDDDDETLDDDDDDTHDDDTLDDDTTDDDDDDLGPAGLLLLGTATDGRPASWFRAHKGWERGDIPLPEVANLHRLDLGPVTVVDGETVRTLWNEKYYLLIGYVFWENSEAEHWLEFTAADGWTLRADLAQSGEKHNVNHLGVDAAGRAWLAAERYEHHEDATGMTDPYLHLFPELAWVDGAQAGTETSFVDDNLYALAVTADDYGIGVVDGAQPRFLLFDGEGWTDRALPEEFAAGRFNDLALLDADHGWGVFRPNGGYAATIVAIDHGQYEAVALPPACDLLGDLRADRVVASSARVIVPHARDAWLAQYYAGQWECRAVVPENTASDAIVDAAVDELGRGFVLWREGLAQTDHLVELLTDGATEIELPADAQELSDLFVFGENAPARQTKGRHNFHFGY